MTHFVVDGHKYLKEVGNVVAKNKQINKRKTNKTKKTPCRRKQEGKKDKKMERAEVEGGSISHLICTSRYLTCSSFNEMQ